MSNTDRSTFDRSAVSASATHGPAPEGDEAAANLRLQALDDWKDALRRRDELRRRLATAARDERPEPAAAPPPAAAPAAEGRRFGWTPQACALPRATPAPRPPALPRLDADRIAEARQLAQVGSAVPDFASPNPVKRVVARLAARAVLFFAGVITVHQRAFNRLLLGFVETSEAKFDNVAEELRRLHGDIDRLDSAQQNLGAYLPREMLGLGAALEREIAGAAAALRRETTAQETALRQEIARLREQMRDSDTRAHELEMRLADLDCDRAWLRFAELEHREELRDALQRLRALEDELAALRRSVA
jgi:hypothetical protein